MKAMWKDTVLAESNDTILVEGGHYFPPDAVKREYLRDSKTHTVCNWKGEASYYDVVVEGESNKDAAWYYPEPLEAANNVRGYVAFWKGVDIVP